MTKKISFLLALLIIFCPVEHSWASSAAVLKSAEIKPYSEALEGFRSSCDCSIITLGAGGTEKDRIAGEIKRLHPDMVLAIGMGAFAQVRTIRDLPVIYVMVPHPLSRSPVGENISGVSMYIPPSKYLDSMVKLFPGARRVGLVYDPKDSDAYVKEAMSIARAGGIDLVAEKADTAAAVPRLIDGLKGKIDVLWMLPETDLLNSATVDYMLLFSFENKVPIFTFSEKYVEMGAAAALTVTPYDMGAQAGTIAKKLEAEKSGGRIQVDANVSGLVINRRVLEKLGVRTNEKTMERAEYVN
jgi:ABC-type uncharacterized transport system substrate-binding protein